MAGNNRRKGKGYTRALKGPSATYRKREIRGLPGNCYGTWRAVSVKPGGGAYETKHVSREKAEKRLAGNPRHTGHRVLEYQGTVAAT